MSLLTIFVSKCNNFFDWQSETLIRSFNRFQIDGEIVRLNVCNHFIYGNNMFIYKSSSLNQNTWYAENKALIVQKYVEEKKPKNEFLLLLDSDTVFKSNLDLNYIRKIVKPGVTLTSSHNNLPSFITNETHPYGFYIIHNKDVLKLLENWNFQYQYIQKEFNLEKKYEFKKNWIAEIYSYTLALKNTSIKNLVDKTIMLDVGNEPYQQISPIILKYSSEYNVEDKKFNKMNYSYLNISKCSGNVFENSFATPSTLLKDIISIENTHIINLGFCEYYEYNCNKKCNKEYIENIYSNLDLIKRSWSSCSDQHTECEKWAGLNQCNDNKEFMENNCRKSCNYCNYQNNIYYFILFIFFITILFYKNMRLFKKKEHIV